MTTVNFGQPYWWQKLERGDFPRGPEYVSIRKRKHPVTGKPVATGAPAGNAHDRRLARRKETA